MSDRMTAAEREKFVEEMARAILQCDEENLDLLSSAEIPEAYASILARAALEAAMKRGF